VIIAHIDHGKSTLADRFLELTNTITKEKMHPQMLDTMDLEQERGITIKLQPVRMQYQYKVIGNQLSVSNTDNQLQNTYTFNLIDTPGHVDFTYEVSRSLAAVEGAVLLVDAASGIQAQTLANLHLALVHHLKIIPVVNKIDLPNAETEKVAKQLADLLKIEQDKIIFTSAKTGQGVEEVLRRIISDIPSPYGDINQPLRALIFDSVYDPYRGVIAYVRIVDGLVQDNSKIRLMAKGHIGEVLELGYFELKLQKSDNLVSGEIGYLVTNFKDITEVKVGDTVTVENLLPNISALPGYHEPKPLVFASFYLTQDEPSRLSEALLKLKLNDASLTFSPETSKSFGQGYRCGFLGLLHLEIVKERLEREYQLKLIISRPEVAYQIKEHQSKLEYQEPWVKMEILTPQTYLGKVMELAQSRRAIFDQMQYLGDQVILNYQVPLAEIVVDFYDLLKSVSSGYASLDYQLIGYRLGDLVKLDYLIAGEKIEEFSQIVPRSQVVRIAHQQVNKLKKLIPRQMFEVSIQAAIGTSSTDSAGSPQAGSGPGKILARENLPAFRKDVIAKLYGGDVTRKRKLLEKQKEGKKKMKKIGKLDLPRDIFFKLVQ
jgi:GTP-binding protein LepA